MRILSATDAISPAFARTRLVLFTPLSLGRRWKLAATAYVSTLGTFFLPFWLLALFFLPLIRRSSHAWVVWAIGPGIILLTGLYLFFFTLCSRLQFVLFDIVVHRSQFVAPLWRKYRAPSTRLTRFKLIFGSGLTLFAGVPLLLWIRYVIGSAQSGTSGFTVPANFFLIILAWMLCYLAFLLTYWAGSVLNDLVSPTLALEDTTLAEAFGRARKLIRREPGPVALYAVMKIVLGFAGQMGVSIVVQVVFLIVAGIAAFVSIFAGGLLHAAGVSHLILQVLGGLVMASVYLLFVLSVPMGAGIVITFLESYKQYFLGGRFPLLGELLEPSPIVYSPPPTIATPNTEPIPDA